MNRDEAFFKYIKIIHPEVKEGVKLYIDFYNCWNAAFNYIKMNEIFDFKKSSKVKK